MDNLIVGSIVILRSGGPAMTVVEIREDGFINARWFANDELKYDAFSKYELVKVEP